MLVQEDESAKLQIPWALSEPSVKPAVPASDNLTASQPAPLAAVYVGAMYLDFDVTITGSIPGADIDPVLEDDTLNYQVDVSPKAPWNFVFGESWEINPRWNY